MASSKRALVALLCGFALAACDDSPEQSATAPSTPQAASKVAGLPPEMVAAVSAGKTASVVSVHFALRGVPTIGKPLLVDIAIVPHVPFESLRVTFEARDGVMLGQGKTLGPVLNPPPEKSITHHIDVQPTRDGVYVVSATLDTEGTEGSISRVFFIPVIVGTAGDGSPAAGTPPPAPIPGESAPTPPPAG
jgi:hypothetical protein